MSHYSQLIHEYLDTGLDQAREDALFKAMAEDQDIRIDFNEQLKLQRIASNDMNSISPPIETTNALFGGLGFTIPSEYSEAGENSRRPGAAFIASTSGLGIMQLLRNNMSNIFSIGIAAIISTLLFLNFQDDGEVTSGGEGVTIAQNYNDGSEYAAVPVISSVESSDYNRSTNSSTKNNTVLNSNNNSSESSSNSGLSESDLTALNSNASSNNGILDELYQSVKNSLNEIPSYANSNKKQNQNRVTENDIVFQNVSTLNRMENDYVPVQMTKYKPENNTGFSIEVRSLNPSNNSMPSNLDNNFAVGMNFEFFDDISAVGMLGYEQFYIRTSKPLFEGQETVYSNESMISYMVGFRYAPDELILDGVITPYVQLSGGGISNGFGGKAESGLILTPERKISFIIGYGKTYIKYNFEGNLYNSEKSGLNFGLRYTF